MSTQPTSDGPPLLLAALPPSDGQRKLAFAIIVVFVLAFAATVPFAHTRLVRLDAWIPAFTTALVINDVITSALLFAQFSIARQRALLVLGLGYLFSALVIIPYAMTFPGIFAPAGLLGAGLQSAVWLYLVWHVVAPLSFIAYHFLKREGVVTVSKRPARIEIAIGIALTVAVVVALTWFVIAHHDLLPLIYVDSRSLSPTAKFAAGVVLASCLAAFALLWARGTSVLDLWLMVTLSAWALEITLNGLFLTDRFSLAWYAGRTFALIASCVVLIVLLSETTTLYAHIARSALRQRSARQARQVAMDTMAAAIAHELNQPLGAIALNTDAALLQLRRTPPNLDEVGAALDDIAAASARGGQVIAGLRAMFRKGVHGRALVDMNELIAETLTMLDIELRTHGVALRTELQENLPPIFGDRGQLQQVLLNLLTNALEAMRSVSGRPHQLRASSELDPETRELKVAIGDSGLGIDTKHSDRIFEPFYSTKSSGIGIGLSICRSIIDSHGGSLRVIQNVPYGAIFEIVLPTEGAGDS